MKRASTAWRALRTGLAFACFGAGSLVVGGVVLPWLRFRGASDARCQLAVHRAYRAYLALARASGLIRVHVEGAERLRAPGPLLVVANHPSLLDTPLLGALMPQADVLVSAGWAANPFLGTAARAAGYVRADHGAEAVAEMTRRLRAGRRVVMFPEGTRTPEGVGVGRFHRGAAHMALGSGCELTPVVLTVEPRSLMKGQKWYEVPDRPLEFRIRVLPPLAPSKHLDGGETPSVAARKVTAALRAHFERVLSRGES